jgi:hypothetical protein
MSSEITATQTPIFVSVLAGLLSAACLVLIVMFAWPYVADYYVTLWAATSNVANWLSDAVLAPIGHLVSHLFG